MFEFKLSEDLANLIYSCESRCVVACCGLDALDVRAESIASWIPIAGLPCAVSALDQLENLTNTIADQKTEIRASGFDCYVVWHYPAECLAFLDHLRRETVAALTPVANGLLFQRAWLTANRGSADALLQTILAGTGPHGEQAGDFRLLPVLADALEDAGCTEAAILRHCRQPHPVPGRCWVVEFLAAGYALPPQSARTSLPRGNRVTPFGNFIAVAARGTLMGNRGCLHDEHQRITRPSVNARWILCCLSFKGRKRQIMAPGRYTELFFLDEATGLSAGHRPCAECQRERYRLFRDVWARANPGLAGSPTPSASQLDAALQRERGAQNGYQDGLANLPTGVMVYTEAHRPLLVHSGHLLPWQPEGYGPPLPHPEDGRVTVLTPRSVVKAIAAGYPVEVHASAALAKRESGDG